MLEFKVFIIAFLQISLHKLNFLFSFSAESSGKEPDWNFWKYLVDVNGKIVDAWGPKVAVKEIRPKIAEMVRQIILKKKEEL